MLAYLASSAPRATRKEFPVTGGVGAPRGDPVFKTKFDVSDYSTESARSATIVAYRKSPASSAAMTDKPRGTQSTLELPKWSQIFPRDARKSLSNKPRSLGKSLSTMYARLRKYCIELQKQSIVKLNMKTLWSSALHSHPSPNRLRFPPLPFHFYSVFYIFASFAGIAVAVVRLKR